LSYGAPRRKVCCFILPGPAPRVVSARNDGESGRMACCDA
jgi:hypothetical protein